MTCSDKQMRIDVAEAGDGGQLLSVRIRHPYYIVAPRYVRTSAGVKALHLLCHALNRAGERAYIITHPYYLPEYAVNPDLLTPVLTAHAMNKDLERGLCPITIYPEVFKGNPFRAPFVVRYVMNYPGLLGGDSEFGEDEFPISYSESIAAQVPNNKMTLFIPASDPNVFSPAPNIQRKGTCFYAGKYKDFHHGELFPITMDSVEITRDRSDSQTPAQIADLFRRSEVFYCYENTALAIEAVLCECPVVFLPNAFFDRVIAAEEHGWDGMAWGADPIEVARAKTTVKSARTKYLALYKNFETQLRVFVEQTQQQASARRFVMPLLISQKPPGQLARGVAAWRTLRSLMRERGVMAAVKLVIARLRRRGLSAISVAAG